MMVKALASANAWVAMGIWALEPDAISLSRSLQGLYMALGSLAQRDLSLQQLHTL